MAPTQKRQLIFRIGICLVKKEVPSGWCHLKTVMLWSPPLSSSFKIVPSTICKIIIILGDKTHEHSKSQRERKEIGICFSKRTNYEEAQQKVLSAWCRLILNHSIKVTVAYLVVFQKQPPDPFNWKSKTRQSRCNTIQSQLFCISDDNSALIRNEV